MKKLFWIVGILIVGIVAYALKVSWYERYIYPSGPVAHMYPPEGAAPVPAGPPAGWRTEVQTVEVATPDGLSLRDITYHVNSLDMDFVDVPAGSYQPEPGFRSRSDKWPLRRASRWQARDDAPTITLTRSYYIGAFEVTNTQYERFDPTHKERRPEYQQGHKGDHHPVEPITWREANAFANWLSEKEGRHYRLPTEAEWEYAASAGLRGRVYWGDDLFNRAMANLGGLHSNGETSQEDGYEETAPVGQYPANPWGLYDTIGNSYEWVADWWHPNLKADAVDPTGPDEGRIRMGKGGSWTTRFYAIYTGEDDGNNPADLRDSRGFRLLVEK